MPCLCRNHVVVIIIIIIMLHCTTLMCAEKPRVLTIWTVAEVLLDVSLSFSSQTAGITNNTTWMEKRDGLITIEKGFEMD